jgi:hypothetical protein
MTAEELIARCCFKEIEDKTALEFGVLNEHLDL